MLLILQIFIRGNKGVVFQELLIFKAFKSFGLFCTRAHALQRSPFVLLLSGDFNVPIVVQE